MLQILKRVVVSTLVIVLILTGPAVCMVAHASDMNRLKGISHIATSGRDQVVVYLDKSANYDAFKLSGPYRIVIDLEKTFTYGGHRQIDVTSTLVRSVRFAQFDGETARVVIDLEDAYRYEINGNGRNMIIYIYPQKDSSFPNISYTGDTRQPDEGTLEGSAPGGDIISRGDNERTEGSQVDMGYELSSLEDKITIGIEGHSGVDVMRLSDPDRIVMDFEGIHLSTSSGSVDINGLYVKSIRYAAFDSDTTRVVADLSGQHDYSYVMEDGKLILTVRERSFKNLEYHNSGDRIYLELDGIELTGSKDGHESYYECWFDSTHRNMNISFDSDGRDIGSGEMLINDWYLKSIRVMSSSSKTTIMFIAKDKYKYNIDATSLANGTVVTVMQPQSNSPGRLVVIDPGHGGAECGASYSGIDEKDLNLDIALRLDKLLKERDINTYMIREDDTEISYRIRADIANSMSASLFLSIHNNAFAGNRKIKGTEVLCYNKTTEPGFTGYEFARIVHRHLISSLGTVDRGIIERPNLVVLNGTGMPSVLAEIAYMTNDDDLNLLRQPSFRQKAAQALCDGIVEALEETERQLH